jgi:hypothetical protein
MAYTTPDAVAAIFPDFTRGAAGQLPSDAQIQTWIDDTAGEIDALLKRRFALVISNAGGFDAWIAGLGPDAAALLEKINRFGAAAELGHALGTRVQSAEKLAQRVEQRYDSMMQALNARDEKGNPLDAGPYDLLFDPFAKTESPRPGLVAVAGGDQPDTDDLSDESMSNFFGKFDPKGA